MKKFLLTLAICFGLAACLDDCDSNPAGPDITDPVPTTTTTAPTTPPPIDPATFPRVEVAGGQLWVDGELLKATTAFTLPLQGPGYATSFCHEMRLHGVNTARIFPETVNWIGAPGYLQQVAYEYDYEATKLTIEALGQAGCAVQVVISATWKEYPLQNNLNLVREVTKVFKGYQHIVWSVMNEYRHPSSHPSVNASAAAKHLLREFNAECPSCLVGVDEALRVDTTKHRACGGTGLCDYFAWHPDRNNDKIDNNRFFRSSKRFGQPVFFDEMVAYASEQNFQDYPILRGKGTIALNGQGSELERWTHTNEVYNMALDEGISPCWHAIDQMLCLISPSEMSWPQEH
jgi:hypothetical protein